MPRRTATAWLAGIALLAQLLGFGLHTHAARVDERAPSHAPAPSGSSELAGAPCAICLGVSQLRHATPQSIAREPLAPEIAVALLVAVEICHTPLPQHSCASPRAPPLAL